MDEIMKYIQKHFDVAGGVDNFLILGLESRKNRDLDTFIVEKSGRPKFPGFFKHFAPKTEFVIKKLRQVGEAKQVKTEIEIKPLAVRAGIGKWGKNSLVIHPEFGPWLRFVVIETTFRFPLKPEASELSVYEGCQDCSYCINACNVSAISLFGVPKREKCMAYAQLNYPTKRLSRRCDACLQACRPQR